MTNEPHTLRAHLLDAEPPDQGRRQRLEREIQNMLDNRLTRGGRIGWTISLVGAILGIAFGTTISIYINWDIPLRAIWCVYTLGNLAWAAYSFHVLRTGRFDRRQFGWMMSMLPGLALLITLLILWRAALHPSFAGVLWAFFGLLCFLLDFNWVVHYRIVRSELAAKEEFLRLRLLMEELREKLEPRQ